MPRYVILTHDHPVWHWDFMLESGDVLRTWRLDAEPTSGLPITATPLPDHRLMYLDYEGPVDNQRGNVARWDGGEYELLAEDQQSIKLRLKGNVLRGNVDLTAPDDGALLFDYRAEAHRRE